MSSVQEQFSKYAQEYNSNNIIQQIVSKALVRDIEGKPKKILELGCGSGQVFKNINFPFEYYKAIDFSSEMCKIHPKHQNLEIFALDFDTEAFHENIKNEQYDLILSSSALQWSKNLTKIVQSLAKASNSINMVLFTSNTFKTIFDITNTTSPILDLKEIKKSFNKFYRCEYEVLNYKLEFENKKDLFNYIKNSGVSGDKKSLSFEKAKHLYKNYNLGYLEFEVVFIKGLKC